MDNITITSDDTSYELALDADAGCTEFFDEIDISPAAVIHCFGPGSIGDEYLGTLLNQPSGGGDVPAKTAKPRDGDALVAVVFHPRILLDFHNHQGQIILRLQTAGLAVEVV